MKSRPLAFKLRPKTINDIIGQKHLLDKNGVIFNMIKSGKPINYIFYGYPGIGKTTLATAICNDMKLPYQIFNAAIDKKEKLVEIIDLARKIDSDYVIIIEEIHRLNRDKQDILLPYLENGSLIIFACTTENPFFSINPAIRSRCNIARLNLITPNELFEWLKNKIISNLKLKISDANLKEICQRTNGDVRATLNVIDILCKYYNAVKIDKKLLQQIMTTSYGLASSYGDEYYDILSALHKSIRGSNPDAGIYYLARLLITGDLVSLNRRLIACAYEDIGLANPPLCARVVTACQAAVQLGLPEARLTYGQIVIEMCLSPKSNSSVLAIDKALNDVESGKAYEVPKHLKDNNYKSHAKLGNGGYIYPHDYPYHYIDQEYLPKALKNEKYYISTSQGNESKLNEYLKKLKKLFAVKDSSK